MTTTPTILGTDSAMILIQTVCSHGLPPRTSQPTELVFLRHPLRRTVIRLRPLGPEYGRSQLVRRVVEIQVEVVR